MILKRALIVVSGILLSILTVIGTTALANKSDDVGQEEEVPQQNVKLIYDGRYIFDEMLDKGQKVKIEYEGQVLEDFILEKDEKITLDILDIPENKIVSYWSLENKDSEYIISPVIVAENEINISFMTTKGGVLVDKATVPSMTKTVVKGTKLSDIVPDVQSKEGYHFAGWFTLESNEQVADPPAAEEGAEGDTEDTEKKAEEVTDIAKIMEELNKQLKEKEMQLTKEKDTAKKKALESEIKKIKETAQQKKEESEVVKEYQKVEDTNSELDSDKEYVAILYPDENQNEKDDRKEKISLAVNFGLGNEVIKKEVHVGQPIKLTQPDHKDNVFMGWYKDKYFKEPYDPQTLLMENTNIFAQWKTPQQLIEESGENLIDSERITERVETFLDEKNSKTYQQLKKESEEKAKRLKAKYAEDGAKHTEFRYTLKNFNVQQSFLIKFYDGEEFLFSAALPYGRTLEVLDEEGNKIKEYGIRQKSSIDLNDIMGDSSNFVFDIKTVNKHNAVITQLYPIQNEKENDE